MLNNENFFAIDPETGHFHRIELYVTPYGQQTEALRRFVQEKGMTLKDLFPMERTLVHVTQDQIRVATRLTSLNLNTTFKADADGDRDYLYPFWGEDPSALKLNLPWIVPDDFTVWLGTLWRRGSHACTYLWAVHEEGLCKLPMGNVYNHGQLCIGDHYQQKDNAYAQHQETLDCFEASEWNGDLIMDSARSMAFSRQLFRFDLDRNQWPVPGNWRDLLTVVSNPDWNFIHEHIFG